MKLRTILLASLYSLYIATGVCAEVIATEWARKYDGVDNGNFYQSVDTANALAVDSAGNIAIAARGDGFYVARYSGHTGARLWEQRVGSIPPDGAPPLHAIDSASAVATDQHGNVIATGTVNGDIYTTKYAAGDGHELWKVRFADFGKDDDIGSYVAVDSHGDVIVTGSSVGAGKSQEIVGPGGDISYIPAPRDIYTAKYAGSDGHLIWKQRYDNPSAGNDTPSALAIDRDGNVVITGNSSHTLEDGRDDYDIHTIKYSGSDGHVIWERSVVTPQLYEFAGDLAVEQNGDVIVAGGSNSSSAAKYLAKYASADGSIVWQRRDPDEYGISERIALDSAGDICVTGGYTNTTQLSLAKFRSSDGARVWKRTYSPVDKHAGFYANSDRIQADVDDNFIVGSTVSSVKRKPFAVAHVELAKFRGSDGEMLWEKFFAPLGDGFEEVLGGMELGPEGSVFIAGALYPRSSGSDDDDVDLFAAKLAPTGQLAQLSSRVHVAPGQDAAIGGLIVLGAETRAKKVMIRGVGPSLGTRVKGSLKDPSLELHLAGGKVIFNDNWRDTQQSEIVATGVPPLNDLEPAIVATLPPGAHTAILRGANDTSGIGLVEVYDLNQTGLANLANLSTRGAVGTGDDVLIGGFIVAGPPAATVVVRALGPSLPFAGALSDPLLALHDANGGSIQNDNWRDTQQQALRATGVAPTDNRESAIVTTLPPGRYTVVATGKQGSVGTAMVEIYNLQ